jgi:hypothetical protein
MYIFKNQLMKPILSFLFLTTLLITGCKPNKTEESSETTVESTTELTDGQNQLTEAEKNDGWVLLFDGQSQNGWRTFKAEENDSWEVVDGALHCKPFDDAEKRADIMTLTQYDDFELAFDWKISPQGNSGVIFRATEDYDKPYFTGPEYQVLDDGGYPGEVKEQNFTAANYDMQAPINKSMNPVGEWNSSKIVANGNHIEHWLNGAKVLEYEIGSDEWNKQRAASKWKDVEGYAVPTRGHIDLQDHGNEAWFRNIKIKEL